MTVVEFGKSFSGQICLALGYFDGMHLGHRKIMQGGESLRPASTVRTGDSCPLSPFESSPADGRTGIVAYLDQGLGFPLFERNKQRLAITRLLEEIDIQTHRPLLFETLDGQYVEHQFDIAHKYRVLETVRLPREFLAHLPHQRGKDVVLLIGHVQGFCPPCRLSAREPRR